MMQPSKKMITEKVNLVLNKTISRETLCTWATDYIRNDNIVDVNDIDAWHYLVDISSIDEMIAPGEYLFSDLDIKYIMDQYI